MASRVASLWARQDPAAAADWALRRGDPLQRTAAVQAAASGWAQRDPPAAARWARNAPADVRDGALQSVLTGMASGGTVDRELFAAFSSDRAREQAAARIVPGIARSNIAEARELLEAYVKDPALRSSAEEQIERATGMPGASSILIVR